MKRVLALLICLVCVMSLALPVFAGLKDFIKSPIVKPNPDASGSGSIVISYGDRDKLDITHREDFDKAYDSIVENNNNGTNRPNFNGGGTLVASTFKQSMDDVSDKTDVPTDKLSISDLFALRKANKNNTGSVAGFDMLTAVEEQPTILVSENFANFAALLRFENDQWSIVEEAYINADGDLVLPGDEVGIFAVVVSTESVNVPTMSVGAIVTLSLAAAVVACGVTTCIVLIFKKKNGAAA